ncbi:hypothetical protein BJX63DRAFT_405270 [Aspergillus granulosus]|uniref:SWIM-type domain-containing protein n=1 Tax=Aspergillus granulosus TaxID=176169 RepID=A0ABR4H2A2_9EURO
MDTGMALDASVYKGDPQTDLPRPAKFVNDLLCKLAQYTNTNTTAAEGGEWTRDGTRHPNRQSHHQPASAFPPSLLADLKPLMLTLHCLFPNEFLLALDILDRGLVRRILTEDRAVPGNHEPEDSEVEPLGRARGDGASTRKEDFFFVTSASTTSSHSPPHQPTRWQTKGYEVRLQAWNCSCPAFTLSAFRHIGPEPASPPSPSPERLTPGGKESRAEESPSTSDHVGDVGAEADADADGTDAYSFGGTLPLHPESAPAVCKHILACLLAAMCPGLGGESRGGGQFVTLGMEEVAALCAGWGG